MRIQSICNFKMLSELKLSYKAQRFICKKWPLYGGHHDKKSILPPQGQAQQHRHQRQQHQWP
jgi:hypothetical protein